MLGAGVEKRKTDGWGGEEIERWYSAEGGRSFADLLFSLFLHRYRVVRRERRVCMILLG